MKVLLLTDIPPSRNSPAGFALDQLCRFFPRGSLSCFVIEDPSVEAGFAPDLDWLPVASCKNRVEQAFKTSNSVLSFPFAWAAETLRRRLAVPGLVAKAVAFGRQQRAELIWAALQGQTLIQAAPRIASQIGVPLVTQVRVAPIRSLLENRIDKFSRRATLSDFGRAIKASRVCVTASKVMATEYEAQYGTACVALHPSYPADWGRTPKSDESPGAAIEIGMLAAPGELEEWRQLLTALNMSHWQVRGRSVRINIIDGGLSLTDAPAGRIRHFGWRSLSEMTEILSTMDILYLPVKFANDMKDAVRLSFPDSFPLYLASGRPILLHAPTIAAAASCLSSNGAGVVADFNAAAVYNALCRLVDDLAGWYRMGEAAVATFRRDFTQAAGQSSFDRVVDLATGSSRP